MSSWSPSPSWYTIGIILEKKVDSLKHKIANLNKKTTGLLAISINDISKLENNVDKSKINIINILIALGILLASFILSRIIKRLIKNSLNKVIDYQSPVIKIITRLSSFIILLIGLAVALGFIGINIAWLSLIFTIIAILAFLALKPLVENTSSGLLLRSRNTIKEGSQVQFGKIRGTVIDMNARSIVLQTPDQKHLHISNKSFLNSDLLIYNDTPHRRSELTLYVKFSTNIDLFERKIIDSLKKIPEVLDKPSPSLRAKSIVNNGYIIKVRWWHRSVFTVESSARDKAVKSISAIIIDQKIELCFPAEYGL